MPKYYCHTCCRASGLIAPVDPSALPPGPYQLGKFVKHTAPSSVHSVNSIFHDPDWSAYEQYLVNTAASGCLEIDDQNRKNLILFAGQEVGLLKVNGVFRAPCSGVKLVCSEDAVKAHGFPIAFEPQSRTCESCTGSVPFDPRLL